MENLKKNSSIEDIFIKIISDFINEKISDREVVEKNKDILKDLYQLSAQNNMIGIVFYQIKDLIVKNKYYDKFNTAFVAGCYDSIKKENVVKEINSIFNNNGINHIFLKGTFLKNIYPVPELRTMGDIDILVEEKGLDDIEYILKKYGYKYDGAASSGYVKDYVKGKILVEVHYRSLLSDNFLKDYDLISYFENAFENAVKTNQYEYVLDVNYGLIFLLTHLAKHYYTGGTGLRMFVDVALYLKKYTKEINSEKLSVVLKEIQLYDFFALVNTLCNKWFGSYLYTYEFIIDGNFMNDIKRFIIQNGTFGQFSDTLYTQKMLYHYQGDIKKITSFKLICAYIFPSDEKMRVWCSWYKNLPKIFLPLSWVYRILYVVFVRRMNFISHYKKVRKDSNSAEQKYIFLKKSGLI